MAIVTRFAPSPTGSLHVGGARTALYCWLYARKNQGKFILRIEDTDLERSTDASVQAIFEAMEWLGLNYDEGPYFQTKRFDRYQQVVKQLLDEGKAYRCYCSKERLEKLREEQMQRKEKPRYDGFCHLNPQPGDGGFVIRFKNPTEGAVEFDDLIRGKLSFQNSELDDLIIARGDGTPTYNFTVVVDDWDMKITHVIRGDDHINNTPRQINILKALGATLPHYAHVSMILGPDGKRLSKRHGAAGVMEFKEAGYLPEALLNYIVRLGWSHGDQEIFSREELIQYFDIQGINKAPAAFNFDKLQWLNQHYLKTLDPNKIAQELAWHMQQLHIDTSSGPSLVDIVLLQRERVKTLREMALRSNFFYREPEYNLEAVNKNIDGDAKNILQMLADEFKNLNDWNKEAIHQILQALSEKLNIKLGKIAQPLRVAVTGDVVSPSIDTTLAILGKERVLKRLNHISRT